LDICQIERKITAWHCRSGHGEKAKLKPAMAYAWENILTVFHIVSVQPPPN
jgi:hypothetical protein